MDDQQGGTTSGWGRRLAAVVAAAALVAVAGAALSDGAAAHPRHGRSPLGVKNVIVMISDGGGFNQVAAADYYQYGRAGRQVYERFPLRAAVSTYSYYGSYDPLQAWGLFSYLKERPTDSAAAATALATGVKTYDAAIGVDVRAERLRNVSEAAEAAGKATGVVSAVAWSHATPASFVAHNLSRSNYAAIANEMIHYSATDVIMGAGSPLFDDSGRPLAAATQYDYVGGEGTWNMLVAGVAGGDADADGDADAWTLIQTRDEFERLARARRTPARVCGTAQVATTLQQARGGDGMAAPYRVPLNAGVPSLEVMTRGALNVLDNDRDGLFLMVEGGAVDWASHANQPGRVIEEQIDFNRAVEAVVAWVDRTSSWDETLLIVTADHETGYLWGPGTGAAADGAGDWRPLVNNGRGTQPGMQFNSGHHTNSLVPLYAQGAVARQLRASATGSDPVRGAYLDNTDIAAVIFTNLR